MATPRFWKAHVVFVLLAFTTSVAAQTPPPSPTTVGAVSFARNQVLGVPPNGVAGLLSVGSPLVQRHRVDTFKDSGAKLALGENASLSLGAETSVTLDEITLKKAGAGQSRLLLLLGKARVELNRLFGGLEVETPTAVIGIKGTVLDIDATGTFTRVTVLEGLVTVTSKAFPKKPIEVKAGESTEVESGKEPSPPRKVKEPQPPNPAEASATTTNPGGPPPGTPPPPQLPTPTATSEPPARGPATITGCAPRGQAGHAICLCGNFPSQSLKGLSIDGQPLKVVASGPGRVQVLLPSDLPAGEAEIRGETKAGFARRQRCEVDVWRLETDLEDVVRQGRSTELTVTAIGTRDPVRVRITNLSPDIVRLEGGNERVVRTGGGRNNRAVLDVETLRPGKANIRFEIEGLSSCPCAGQSSGTRR